jgi:hypothetical protein
VSPGGGCAPYIASLSNFSELHRDFAATLKESQRLHHPPPPLSNFRVLSMRRVSAPKGLNFGLHTLNSRHEFFTKKQMRLLAAVCCTLLRQQPLQHSFNPLVAALSSRSFIARARRKHSGSRAHLRKLLETLRASARGSSVAR